MYKAPAYVDVVNRVMDTYANNVELYSALVQIALNRQMKVLGDYIESLGKIYRDAARTGND